VGANEEAILEPSSLVGHGVEDGSQRTNGMAVEIGEGPEGVLVGHSVDLEASCGLLHPWEARRGGGCCWEANHPLAKKWSAVILF